MKGKRLFFSVMFVYFVAIFLLVQAQDEQRPSVSMPIEPSEKQVIASDLEGIEPSEKLIVAPDLESHDMSPTILDGETFFDESAKRQSVVRLVDRGVAYFNQHLFADSCHEFTHTKSFVEGELYLFLYSADGTVFAHGQQVDLLWQNLYNLHDSFGTPIVQSIIEKARQGGGWVTYQWRNITKVSYVKEVQKEGKSYIIGTGYYPHSKVDAVVNLVKGAVGFFNKAIKEGRIIDEAFSPLSYPIGRFVHGDLYLYAIDFKGTIVAHGQRPGLIGSNALNYKDSNGVFVNKEIIKKLKSSSGGIWVKYISGGAPKRTYAEKVEDASGNSYFIACGFYTDADRKKTEDLVRKGYQFIKTHGISMAEKAFIDIQSPDYRYGDLFLFIYDMQGKVFAYGTNLEAIGQNHYDHKDELGRFYVRDIIQKAKEGGGWIDVKLKNSFKSIYVEKVDLGVDSYVIGSGLYPGSKNETMELLARSAAEYLQLNELKNAFAKFVDKEGRFIRGDLSLFVFDTDGICYLYGDENTLIWRKLISVTDDKGYPFVQDIINKAKYGPGNVRYVLNGVEKNAYVRMVQKDNKMFVVGSSYFK